MSATARTDADAALAFIQISGQATNEKALSALSLWQCSKSAVGEIVVLHDLPNESSHESSPRSSRVGSGATACDESSPSSGVPHPGMRV